MKHTVPSHRGNRSQLPSRFKLFPLLPNAQHWLIIIAVISQLWNDRFYRTPHYTRLLCVSAVELLPSSRRVFLGNLISPHLFVRSRLVSSQGARRSCAASTSSSIGCLFLSSGLWNSCFCAARWVFTLSVPSKHTPSPHCACCTEQDCQPPQQSKYFLFCFSKTIKHSS